MGEGYDLGNAALLLHYLCELLGHLSYLVVKTGREEQTVADPI